MIELRDVSKTVMSGSEPLTILHPLSMTIARGQFLAIVGPSGSGKSTLLGLIAGLDAPTSGSVLIDGVDITRLDEDRLAKLRGEKIGFVFQFFHLIPSLTALENVSVPMEIIGLRDARQRAEALLEEVGLTGRAHHYPSQLSGGEQQRVALARALANDPPIVLADEPTGNLDTPNGRHIMELLRTIHERRGTTIVLVTHDAELAALADTRLVLRDGRVVETVDREIAARPWSSASAPRRSKGTSREAAMMFVLRMAVRETRASWRRLLFFFLCIAVGVAAIVTLRSVIRERPRRLRTRSQGADCRRRADFDQRRVDRPRHGRRSTAGSPSSAPRSGPSRSRRRRCRGRRMDGRSPGWWSCARCRAGFRSTGRSVSRAARPTRTRCCGTTAHWSVRSC